METTAPKLHSLFPEEDIGWMVTCQSVLLVEDIDYILQELARFPPPPLHLSKQDISHLRSLAL